MFRGLLGFGKKDGPTPPKNQIEVVCPACGAAQYEPRLVVSTFCRECGVHLRIEKRRVIASEVSKSGGNPEHLRPKRDAANPPSKPLAPPAPPSAPLNRPVSGVQEAPSAPPTGKEVQQEFGLGMMIQAGKPADPQAPAGKGDPDEEAKTAPDFIEIPENLSSQPSREAPATGMQRLKDQGFYRQQYFKEAQCFECDHKFKVGRSSRSANCPACGAAISMEDVDLNMPSTQSIKTRGDVIIRKRGQLSAAHLFCRELRCYGNVTAEINCTGDAIFKTSGTIVGEIRCRRLIVEKGSEITFMNAIQADDVEIHAHITGNVFSAGQVLISANGAVNGDVTARSVSIEPGGELNGAMNIVRNTAPKAPPTTI